MHKDTLFDADALSTILMSLIILCPLNLALDRRMYKREEGDCGLPMEARHRAVGYEQRNDEGHEHDRQSRNMYIKADAGCPRHRGCGPYRHW